MKLKFNRMERIAGFFLLVAVLGTGLATVGVIVKRGFFDPKVTYVTTVSSAANLRVGTPVNMAGLRVGSVSRIKLAANGEVRVKFGVHREYAELVRLDSRIRIVRPSIIGEKVFDISVGAKDAQILAEGATVPCEDQADIVDALSTGRFIQMVANLEKISAETLEIFQQANHHKNMQKLVENLVIATDQLRKTLPAFVGKSPKMAEDFSVIMANFATLTSVLGKLAPALGETAGSIPDGTKKLVELVSETLVLVKGMQRSFVFRGGVNDVKEEDEKKRAPAEKRDRD